MDSDTKLDPDTLECLEKNYALQRKVWESEGVLHEKILATRNSIKAIKKQISTLNQEEEEKDEEEIDVELVFLPEWYEPSGCPPNADTIDIRLQTGGLSWWDHWDRVSRAVIGWTGTQSRAMCSVIHDMEVQDRISEYSEKKSRLVEIERGKAASEEILTLQSELAMFDVEALKEKTLEELVLTGKGKYDWEKVSALLHNIHTARECHSQWLHYLHPSINTAVWTEDEDLRLVEIADQRGEQDWESIASELGTGRSAYACFVAYKSRLHGTLAESQDKEEGWTAEEDEALVQAVNTSGGPNGVSWDLVAQSFPAWSRKEVCRRWTCVLDPRLKRGPLSHEEKQNIVLGVSRFGMDFARIQNCLVPERSTAQIQYFVKQHINKTCRRGRWGLFTVFIFKALVGFLGPDQWPVVCTHFPHHSAEQLKLRYTRLGKLRDMLILPMLQREPAICQPVTNRSAKLGQVNEDVDEEWENVQAELKQENEEVGENWENLQADLSQVKEDGDVKCENEPAQPKHIRKRGRPPSRKKRKEQTEAKRRYIFSGRYKKTGEAIPEASRELRAKP